MNAEKHPAQDVAEAYVSSLFVPAAPIRLDCILPSSFGVIQHQSQVIITTLEGLASKSIGIVEAMPSYKNNSTVETVIKPGPMTWMYDDIAAILLEFVIIIDGEEVLGGAGAFGMLKTDSGWMISGIESALQPSTQELHSTSQTPEGALHRVESFIEHLKQHDWSGMIADCLPGGGITLSRVSGYKTLPFPDLIEQLKRILSQRGDLVEELHDVEIKVLGNLALAWTPFTVSLEAEINMDTNDNSPVPAGRSPQLNPPVIQISGDVIHELAESVQRDVDMMDID
ncbi:uncharacterized protein TRIVIDRAFT_219831 [Trichoderma virens Gv29-8]|uniref:Uncharacterized protein n=1 Tax=Hypocrea virens (strain Gv29-8 / FGSC 10586) TaxID=413071 RepID=G9MM03_HYPVG|nr:uncharacterized protein TRIVIDRAFT_219831 [Trichoderma virens Gv29-8]EHK24376.1 hypothetical protein TRIVIDRAFT_219831 [Trichoderma virens Gv29-8]UKZ54643.1 hypothetical protein TrVGV298_008455 [Trichoderma virens]